MFKNYSSEIQKHFLSIFVYNLILMVLILLRSAGYFDPYFPITINVIFLIGLLLSIPLLRAKSRHIFIIALLTWIFSGLMLIFKIQVWADRTSIYTYQSLIIGTIMLIVENLFDIDNNKKRS